MTDYQPKDPFLQIADAMLAINKNVRLNAGAVLERFGQCRSFCEALYRVQSEPSPNEEPPWWDNDPEPQEIMTAQQKLHVVLEGISEPECTAHQSEESLTQRRSSMFQTISAFHEEQHYQQHQLRASSSQTTIIQTRTQIQKGSAAKTCTQYSRRFSLQVTARNEVRKSSKRSILAPVRQGSRDSIDKSRLKERYQTPPQQIRRVKPEFRSLQLCSEQIFGGRHYSAPLPKPMQWGYNDTAAGDHVCKSREKEN